MLNKPFSVGVTVIKKPIVGAKMITATDEQFKQIQDSLETGRDALVQSMVHIVTLESALADCMKLACQVTLCLANQDETRRDLPGKIIARIEEVDKTVKDKVE